jgi:hypothetical protein
VRRSGEEREVAVDAREKPNVSIGSRQVVVVCGRCPEHEFQSGLVHSEQPWNFHILAFGDQ